MPNISISRLERLERDAAELLQIKDTKRVKPFVDAMLENLGIILANKKFDSWPEEAKIAYKHAEEKFPGAAAMYRKRIDK